MFRIKESGAEEVRTPDPLLAKQVLSQLSYSPELQLKSKILILEKLEALPTTKNISKCQSSPFSYFINSKK